MLYSTREACEPSNLVVERPSSQHTPELMAVNRVGIVELRRRCHRVRLGVHAFWTPLRAAHNSKQSAASRRGFRTDPRTILLRSAGRGSGVGVSVVRLLQAVSAIEFRCRSYKSCGSASTAPANTSALRSATTGLPKTCGIRELRSGDDQPRLPSRMPLSVEPATQDGQSGRTRWVTARLFFCRVDVPYIVYVRTFIAIYIAS